MTWKMTKLILSKKDEGVRQSVEKNDQEETGDGEQSISPTLYVPEQNEKKSSIKTFDEDQNDLKTEEKPPISFGFNVKPKQHFNEGEIDIPAPPVIHNINKGRIQLFSKSL